MADILIAFKGKEYRVREDRAFQIGERVEAIATLGEISGWNARPEYHRMARCVGEVLRFAGCKTSDREVFEELMLALKSGEPATFLGVLMSLINVLTHGMLIDEQSEEAAPSGETDPS